MSTQRERSPFFAFRYLVVPSSTQLSLFPETTNTKLSKEDLMHEIWLDLQSNPKIPFTLGSKRFLFYRLFPVNNTLFGFMFAKANTRKSYHEGDDGLITRKEDYLSATLFYVDSKTQVILMQRKTSAFKYPEASVSKIEDYLRDRMKSHGYSVNIFPLSDPDSFWQFIDDSDRLYELSLVASAPNISFGNEDLRHLLQTLKDDSNNDTVSLSVKSTDGYLKVKKESFIGKVIDYVSSIGGFYSAKVEKNGVKINRNSSDDTYTMKAPSREPGDYSDMDIADIKLKIEDVEHKAKKVSERKGKKKKSGKNDKSKD